MGLRHPVRHLCVSWRDHGSVCADVCVIFLKEGLLTSCCKMHQLKQLNTLATRNTDTLSSGVSSFRIWLVISLYIHKYIYVLVYLYIYTKMLLWYFCIYIHEYIYICICIYIYIYIYVYIYIYMYVCLLLLFVFFLGFGLHGPCVARHRLHRRWPRSPVRDGLEFDRIYAPHRWVQIRFFTPAKTSFEIMANVN